MEEDKNIALFEAAYYAELPIIEKWVSQKEDIQITTATKDSGWDSYLVSDFVNVSILDMLNWAACGMYDCHDQEKLCFRFYNAEDKLVIERCINAAVYYKKVVNCIEWICKKFSIENYHLKDYSPYSELKNLSGENWLDENEIRESLEKGFRLIDLNLINEGVKGNGISCYNLIRKGANYKIDPMDFSDESTIEGILSNDRTWHTDLFIIYLFHKRKNKPSEFYDMLSSLYTMGVSQYILDIVKMEDDEI